MFYWIYVNERSETIEKMEMIKIAQYFLIVSVVCGVSTRKIIADDPWT